MGAQKSHLIEAVLMSTHNICYGKKIRKNNFHVYTIIWGPELNFIYNWTPLDMHNVLSQVHNNYHVVHNINSVICFLIKAKWPKI